MIGEAFPVLGKQLVSDPDHSYGAFPMKPWSDFGFSFTVEYPAPHFEVEIDISTYGNVKP